MWGRRKEIQTEVGVLPAGEAILPSPITSAPTNIKDEETSQIAETHSSAANASKRHTSDKDETTQQLNPGKMIAATLGSVVNLLMRSPLHKAYTLKDLEWLLLPPLALNQFLVADMQLENGMNAPAGVILWARVSDEIDARLTGDPHYPMRLEPNDWASGGKIWLVDMVGEARALEHLVDTLAKTAFAGKTFKMLVKEDNGRLTSVEISGAPGND